MDELKAVLVGSLDCNYIQLYTKKKKKKKKKSNGSGGGTGNSDS